MGLSGILPEKQVDFLAKPIINNNKKIVINNVFAVIFPPAFNHILNYVDIYFWQSFGAAYINIFHYLCNVLLFRGLIKLVLNSVAGFVKCSSSCADQERLVIRTTG